MSKDNALQKMCARAGKVGTENKEKQRLLGGAT